MDEDRYRAAERRLWDSFGITPTERRLRLAHIGATVRVQETGDGRAVLFVHGATNGGTSWAPLVARMEGFRCIVLDRPGCGLSEPLPERFESFDELGAFADDLIAAMLDALGIARAYVIATSFGGYIALRGAAAHPGRIARIFELGWPGGASGMPTSVRIASVPIIGRVAAMVPLTDRTVRAMLRRIGLRHAVDAGLMSQAMIDWYLALLRDTDTLRNELAMGPRFPLRAMDERALLPEPVLARVDPPVHLLWGMDDPFGGAKVAQRFVALLPHAELELLPGVGHAPWIDDPERAATTAHTFLVGE